MERVSHPTLGPDRGVRLLHDRSVDAEGPSALYRPLLYRAEQRRVEIGGIASKANGLWMAQIARNVTDDFDGFFKGKRYLIHDRDPLYTQEFLNMLKEAGIQSVKLPPRSPNLNAYAERFVRSIKEDCLEQVILFGEDSLRNGIHQFLEHYHRERNHQGLENRLIVPSKAPVEHVEQWNVDNGWADC